MEFWWFVCLGFACLDGVFWVWILRFDFFLVGLELVVLILGFDFVVFGV